MENTRLKQMHWYYSEGSGPPVVEPMQGLSPLRSGDSLDLSLYVAHPKSFAFSPIRKPGPATHPPPPPPQHASYCFLLQQEPDRHYCLFPGSETANFSSWRF